MSSDSNSESRSTTGLSIFSEETLVPFEAVTALAPAPDGMSYTMGRKDGSVLLCQKGRADGTELAKFQRFFDVQHIKWSHDGNHVVLGDLMGNIAKLVFLDHDLWICSYALDYMCYGDIGTTAYQRLYFIPRDWVGNVSLDRCTLMRDGTLFWPPNDGVIAIESNLDENNLSYLD